MTAGYISIGSNIDKDLHIPASLAALRQVFGPLVISSVYEAEAVGFVGDIFYNLVVGFESDWAIEVISKQLRQIELDNGRSRCCQKFSARTLDLDLILFGDRVTSDGNLHIPRDEIERYAFVLEPLAEIAPTLRHPVNGIDYQTLWQRFDKKDIKQRRVHPQWLAACLT